MRVAQPIKVLLLGAKGQLGRALMTQPLWRQFATVVLSHQQLDITNTAALAELFSLHSPDVVINCAAFTGVEQAEQQAEQCYAVNTAAVQQLAQLCQRYHSLFIQFSTDYVFSGSRTIAYSETDEPAPLNIYGQSKWQAEQAVQAHCSKYLLIRTSWLFSGYGHNFYRSILHKASQGLVIRVVDDQIGCPTYAGDLAAIVVQLIARYQQDGTLAYGLYHISGTPAVSWHQFALAILASHHIAGNITAVSSQSWPTTVQRPKNSALDCTRFAGQFTLAIPCWRQALQQLAKDTQ